MLRRWEFLFPLCVYMSVKSMGISPQVGAKKGVGNISRYGPDLVGVGVVFHTWSGELNWVWA